MKKLSLLLVLSYVSIFATSYQQHWNQMQIEYEMLCNKGAPFLYKDSYLCHPHWIKAKNNIKQIISGPANPHFVRNQIISNEMVRGGIKSPQIYEISYLKECLSPETKLLLNRFNDTDLVGLTKECKEFNCSTNTLGHLFYAAKSLEQFKNKDLTTIVEFGGGYGNLARIFKSILPKATIFLIDLPELLALQYFFLKATLPETTKVIIHAQAPENFEAGAIHLIPHYIVEDIKLKTDLFISTFALSEGSEYIQKSIIQKKFFDASVCYIVGQLHGWGELNFVNHSNILDTLRKTYQNIDCHPYHLILDCLHSYEIIGQK